MGPQSRGSPNFGNFGTPIWESWDKMPFGCGLRGEAQNILQGGRWWLPQVWVMVSLVSPSLPMARPNTKSAPNYALTNSLFSFVQVHVSD